MQIQTTMIISYKNKVIVYSFLFAFFLTYCLFTICIMYKTQCQKKIYVKQQLTTFRIRPYGTVRSNNWCWFNSICQLIGGTTNYTLYQHLNNYITNHICKLSYNNSSCWYCGLAKFLC